MGQLRSGARRVLRWDPYLEPGDSDMRFRLTYHGLLLAHRDDDGKRAGALHKHSIRRRFHSQLRYLWAKHPMLSLRLNAKDGSFYSDWRPDRLGDNFSRNGFRHAPLVTGKNNLVCSVEILLLRPTAPGGVIKNSDIDNRLKALFDALRMTKSTEELQGSVPESDEDPFYVLLEDDSLITHVSVKPI